jgi:hypothetical protein
LLFENPEHILFVVAFQSFGLEKVEVTTVDKTYKL